MKRKENKQVLLKGDGINQHTLYGKFAIDGEITDFVEVSVKDDCVLKHEEENGKFAEHQALAIDKGIWVMGKQVEYNPFSREVSRVWD